MTPPTTPAGAGAPIDLWSAFEARCAAAADSGALLSEDGVTTFGELAERVDRMMGLVRREGWTPGTVVGLAVKDERLHLAAAIALLCLGAAQVGLPSSETDASNRSVAARTGASLIMTDGDVRWADGLSIVVVSEASLRLAPRGGHEARGAAPDDVGVYVKTSGSTDAPKLFETSFSRTLWTIARYAGNPGDRCVMRTSSTDFDSSRLHRAHALLAGLPTVFAPRDMARMGEICARFGVSQVHIGTYRLASLVGDRHALRRLPETTGVLAGGSRVPGLLRARVAERLSRNLSVSYATSEIGKISTATPDQHARYPDGVGFPEAGVEVELVDADGAPVEPGEIGQIRVRKAIAPQRYLGEDPDQRQFGDGWFYPNDLVAQPRGAPLIYHGRSDDVMLLNGVKVSGTAIEDALAAIPGVREAAAFAVASRVHGEIPAAAVVLSDTEERLGPAELIAECRRMLGLRAPRRIVIVEAIPRTATGKPLKRELAKL